MTHIDQLSTKTDRSRSSQLSSHTNIAAQKAEPSTPTPPAPVKPLTAAQKYALAIQKSTSTDPTATLNPSPIAFTAPATTTPTITKSEDKMNELIMQKMLAAMEDMPTPTFSNRVYDPVIDTDHPDDKLGFVSPTFRSGFVSIIGECVMLCICVYG